MQEKVAQLDYFLYFCNTKTKEKKHAYIMKIAVVGATGLVGSVILKVLEERGFTNCDVIAVASEKSVGKTVEFGGKNIPVIAINDAISQSPDYAIFSAGSGVSTQYAPLFAKQGTTVIDNSSAWRKDENIPLVVPEINFDVIKQNDRIIANPNCSTIQMVLALFKLHERYRIKRLVISTYQSITGTGMKAIEQLEAEERGCKPASMAYEWPIHRNLFPKGGDFLPNGYTTEEQKLVDETRKILRDNSISVTATVVRVPVVGGHSESVNIEFHENYDMDEVLSLLENTDGLTLMHSNDFQMPMYAEGKDEVFVGRVRRDDSQPNSLNMWIVADNLRKGAATNAVAILERMIKTRNK